MRVALSVDALSPQLTGIGRYSWELAKQVPHETRVGRVDFFRGNEWIGNPARLVGASATPGYKAGLVRRAAAALRSHLAPPHVVHAPNYFLPSWAPPGTGIATIHDLSVFRFPETHPADRIATFEQHFSNTVESAALLLTDSEWNRRELIEFAGVPPDRVKAVPLGVGSAYRPREKVELAPFLAPLGLQPGRYGLCVSTFEPRKRIDRLVSAWRLLPAALRERYPLVLAGASGWKNEKLNVVFARGLNEGWLRLLGFVDEAALPLLYAGAGIFAYPSRYEGFGLPPLEAMASGVPTIVAPGTCVTEIAGDGARVVDPEDADGFADTIEAILEDEHSREEWVRIGLQTAARYTWENCVARTVDAYTSLTG